MVPRNNLLMKVEDAQGHLPQGLVSMELYLQLRTVLNFPGELLLPWGQGRITGRSCAK